MPRWKDPPELIWSAETVNIMDSPLEKVSVKDCFRSGEFIFTSVTDVGRPGPLWVASSQGYGT